jgi:glycosyltransferase involved in cell wall biosynthesis
MLDGFLDSPRLIRRVTSRAMDTDARFLGQLALSMFRGEEGNQRKEVRRLVRWLVHEGRPDLVLVTNILIAAFARSLKRQRDIPVVVMLQGDDVFLEQLEPAFREQCLAEIRRIAEHIDGFVTHSSAYRDRMAAYLGIDPARIAVVPLGIDPAPFAAAAGPVREPLGSAPFSSPRPAQTVGYLARLAPEKGLHLLVEAFIRLSRSGEFPDLQLKVAGWLGPPHLEYAEQQWSRLREAGLADRYEYLGVVSHLQKLDLYRSISLLSVPTVQAEPKGLFALEALASGLPVVMPAHGAFPELLASTGGGRLFRPGDAADCASQIAALLRDPGSAQRLGEAGRSGLLATRTAHHAAAALDQVLSESLARKKSDLPDR